MSLVTFIVLTGFGHDLARRLDELEFVVFAGCLKPGEEGARKLKSSSSKRLHVVPLDVGSDSSVEEAREYVKKHLPKNGKYVHCNDNIEYFNSHRPRFRLYDIEKKH